MKILAFIFGAVTAAAQTPIKDLTQASLEDLLNTSVTSVSKKEQKLSRTPAAVFVITQEDIRRSSYRTIPDLLRMVPGVTVGRVDEHTWSISIRGFNDLYGNKVLVMIDGRPMYRPSFSGVRWDEVDVPLENIDRIEVIRGPGSTVWGANAVNGVINILTKTAWETQGGLVSLSGGTEMYANSTVQYGGVLNSRSAFRAFGRYWNAPDSPSSSGRHPSDHWFGSHGGFRFDRGVSPESSLTITADVVNVHSHDTLGAVLTGVPDFKATLYPEGDYSAASILLQWKRALKNGSRLSFQAYNDHYSRQDRGGAEYRNTIDFEFEHQLRLGSRHELVYGLGYRYTTDRTPVRGTAYFNPARSGQGLYSAYLQDEIRLTDKVSFTLGSKFEHNVYSHFECEPSAQLVWAPSSRQTWWASAARAIRQPSRADEALFASIGAFPLGGGGLMQILLVGNPNSKPEEMRAVDFGYRATIGRRLSLDLAGFSNHYRRLRTAEPLDVYPVNGPGAFRLALPLMFDSKASAHSFGGELSANWTVNDRLRVTASYSALRIGIRLDPGSQDRSAFDIPGMSPQHQTSIRSFLSLPHNFELDGHVGYIGMLRTGPVAGYPSGGLRFGWRIRESTELSVTGSNLFKPRHAEFPDEYGRLHTEVDRSLTMKFVVRF